MNVEKLVSVLKNSRKAVFFGGAGVSTESGIPDFRSKDGLYSQNYDFPPEEILSHTFFMRNTEEFYRFYKNKMLLLDKKPNAAHYRLAEWEKRGIISAVVTQNIDGFHTQAGSHTVYELHGSVHRNSCLNCGRKYDAEYIAKSDGIPRCACGGILKPDVILYEEGLDGRVLDSATGAIVNADTLIVAGTSLTVYPAASLVRYFRGNNLVLINRDPGPLDDSADIVYRDGVAALFAACEF